jgi:Cu-processing system ATP-binding protein
MIKVQHIFKRFGNFEVLKDIDLAFKPGSCVALIGPNGSGKTTLLKTVLQMVQVDKGDLLFMGESILGQWEYRRFIGFMPQMTRYPENMTIGEVIDMMIDMREHVPELDEELIKSFLIKELYHKRMGTLSGGTRQKVGACLAFLFSPYVLILDEPTAGLDPLSAEILKQKIIKEKANGKLIIISSHVLSELDELASEVVYMQEGSILFQKSIEDLKSETHELKLSKILEKKFREI